jgi:tRNA (cytidine/uridine-2'-O-)-methyltransferase
MIQFVLVQPEIPQNIGSVLRTCACFDIPLHIVGPFGFVWDVQKLKRVAMDYERLAKYCIYPDYASFKKQLVPASTLIGTTPSATAITYHRIDYTATSVVLFGSESTGLPKSVLASCHTTARIPIQGRSLNLSVAVGIFAAQVRTQLCF